MKKRRMWGILAALGTALALFAERRKSNAKQQPAPPETPPFVFLIPAVFRLSPQSQAKLEGVHPELVAVVTRAIEAGPSTFDVIGGTRREVQLTPIDPSRGEVIALGKQLVAAQQQLNVKAGGSAAPGVVRWRLRDDVGEPNTAGYRRARQAEVTPYMTAQARAALHHRLGDVRGPFLNERGQRFKVRLEVHSNAPKGASVFLEAD